MAYAINQKRGVIPIGRPTKRRKVCGLPAQDRFGPLGIDAEKAHQISMTVDEYETIRLIDLDGLTQEECAAQMKVARSTVQGIYLEARRKVAHALVYGKLLSIAGGEYRLCDGAEKTCGRGCHRAQHGMCWKKHRILLPFEEESANYVSDKKEEHNMKITVASEDGKVFGHFGHCKEFMIFSVEDQKIVGVETVANPGHKPGFLPNFLEERGTNVVIAGGMGAGATGHFKEKQIEIIVGASGDAREAVEAYLQGKLKSTGEVCHHHDHEHHHHDH